MIAAVADTDTAIWYLFNDPRLSKLSARFIERAAAEGDSIAVSSLSLAEIVFLVEKKRLAADVYVDVEAALADAEHVFKEAAFTVEVVEAMRLMPRSSVPDMPDRIAAATAVHLGVPVVSCDGSIKASNVRTIW